MAMSLTPKDDVKNYLEHCPDSRYAHTKFIGDHTCTVNQGACHAQLHNVNNPKSIGTGCLPDRNQEQLVNRLIDWALNPDISPWRNLLKYGYEKVNNKEGRIRGIILPQETLEAIDFYFVKNFCIFLRVLTEKYNQTKTWELYVNKYGLDPRDAYFLASLYHMPNNGGPEGSFIKYELHGWHSPITDSVGCPLDWDIWYTGNVIKNNNLGQQINGFFCKQPTEKYIPFSSVDMPLTQIKGAFSVGAGFSPDTIVEEFYKWKKKFQLPGKYE